MSEHYLFNGKEKDSTGLHYYGTRYYDPQIGRFIIRDLIKGNRMNSQSLNRYSCCLNNPIKYIDPEGLVESKFSIEGEEHRKNLRSLVIFYMMEMGKSPYQHRWEK